MLIVHVITRLLRAGSEENTIATCLGQARAGHQVILLHGAEWNPTHAEHCSPTFRLLRLENLVHPIDIKRDVAAVREMRDLFRAWKPAVVHTHQSKAGILGRLAARLAHVPTIIHGVHIVPFVGVGPLNRFVYLSAERALARVTSAFINVSEGTRRMCLDDSVGRPEQHFVAHSGMNLDRFQRGTAWPDDWRTLLDIPHSADKPPVVLMLAALEERKRHVGFLEAFGDVLRRVPEARLVLAGEGPNRAEVEATIERLGFGRNVRLLGFHPEPEKLIALSDLSVLTSVREGLPRVIVQSMAGGRPVVATRLPGLEEIVDDGVNGIIVGPDDLAGAARITADLLLDGERLGRLKAGAERADVSRWGTDAMCGTIARIYERVVPAKA